MYVEDLVGHKKYQLNLVSCSSFPCTFKTSQAAAKASFSQLKKKGVFESDTH